MQHAIIVDVVRVPILIQHTQTHLQRLMLSTSPDRSRAKKDPNSNMVEEVLRMLEIGTRLSQGSAERPNAMVLASIV